ncbi:HAMP domain-containing histidine kinase [Ornithinibacillus sp. BX22]|uniref:histidine kinase n=2 Tax=Ornithinibacillus TaxID=484508 RepID=A0A923L7B3_9BACI|nr:MULTISPECIES: HAMP domain-containing sensor histidine kinase [Ornithinibacillus]MBC5637742.1 HAMP domain-containing histidine kinase [Ornithinibacillus hominis]MBS3681584.1 HAMP domain-containing histidine kinase [Ornithinibacillus massiliensis]
MKKLRWRLFLNFLFQFILIAATMLFLILITLMFAVIFFTKDYSEQNYYQAMLESISMDTGNSLRDLQMAEGWDDNLKEQEVWVQIIDENGNVTESGNVPEDIPNHYSQYNLITMKQTKEINGYSLAFYLETFYENNYLFLLGYEDFGNHLLQTILEDYGENGQIPDSHIPEVERILSESNGKLEIFDSNETLLLTIGNDLKVKEKPLNVFLRESSPNTFPTNQNFYKDPESDTLWVLYTPNDNAKELELKQYHDLGIAFAITGIIVLFITIMISIWNGFRYGHPLFIFSNWLSRMGNQEYGEVLTAQEKKQVYKRNGKLKIRYRLFKEVFQAFYEMAEKLDRSKKERELLERTREEWMAGISHDLRTPLSTMQGYGNLLESSQYNWSKEELAEIGETIKNKSEYMLRLIEDFTLNFQLKNESATILLQKRKINQFMNELIQKYKQDRTIEEYSLSFAPLEKDVEVEINKRLFERLIDNLIYNAIKHNPIGTKIEILLDKTTSNQLKLTIKDDGVGMDERTKQHLFDRYYRGTNTDEKTEGTGLGMSIALQIAVAHRGEVQVDSKVNEGTSVSVTLPLSTE